MPSPLETQRMIDHALELYHGRMVGRGQSYYVDGLNGNDNSNGKHKNHAFKTVAQALSVVNDRDGGDTIFLMGRGTTFTEGDLTLSADQTQIIGLDPTRHAARIGADAGETVLTITGDECRLQNLRVNVPAYNSGGGIGLALNGSYGLELLGLRFQAATDAYYGVNIAGASGVDNMIFRDCEFAYFNTATHGHAIRGHTFTADVVPSLLRIERCLFTSNLNNIVSRMRQSFIVDCRMPEKGVDTDGSSALTVVKKIDLSGTQSVFNLVTGNYLGGDYSNTGGYTAGTNDDWAGNISPDTAEAEVGDNGITITVPAA